MTPEEIRKEFPLIFFHPEITYLDSAATAQRPRSVIEAERQFYLEDNANPMRGIYGLSQRATNIYEDARETVRAFLNAESGEEIIFTRNATESLNLVAYSLGAGLLPGDEIAVTVAEHHSNLVPWQQAAARKGAKLSIIECDKNGLISEETFMNALSDRTRIVAMTQVSNVVGMEYDVRHFAALAHEAGALFVCDGSQSVPHMKVDVRALGVDFLAFSGHKMGAPMGIGVLYGKKKLLEKMPPFLTGGEMIEYVTRESATWAELPHRFEAGTVNAAGAAGLAAAIRFYQKIGMEEIERIEAALGERMYRELAAIPHVHIVGPQTSEGRKGIFTFTVDGVHPHDIAEILNADGICVRAGHHCAQPLMKHLGMPATARVSLMFYNTEEEIRRLGDSLRTVRRRMGYAE